MLSYYVALIIISLFIYFKMFKRSVQHISNVNNKYILITGCGSGFGRETAIRLDALGFNVFATCHTENGAQSLRDSCSERVHVIHLDVTDSLQVKAAYDYVKKTMSSDVGLWCVINNAGVNTFPAPFDWQTVDEMKKMADVNLWGLIDVTKTFLALLKISNGRLVNVSSIMGRVSLPYVGAYCVTKYGVEAFTDSLRREMCKWNMKMILIEPGCFMTNMMKQYSNYLDKIWAGLPEDKKLEYGEDFLKKTKEASVSSVEDFTSLKIELVTEAIVDAVMSVSPKYRYVVGWDANLFFGLLTWLPTWIADTILYHVAKIQVPAVLQDSQQINK